MVIDLFDLVLTADCTLSATRTTDVPVPLTKTAASELVAQSALDTARDTAATLFVFDFVFPFADVNSDTATQDCVAWFQITLKTLFIHFFLLDMLYNEKGNTTPLLIFNIEISLYSPSLYILIT